MEQEQLQLKRKEIMKLISKIRERLEKVEKLKNSGYNVKYLEVPSLDEEVGGIYHYDNDYRLQITRSYPSGSIRKAYCVLL